MNTFGNKFRISIFGESHGEKIGVVIDGVRAGLSLCVEDFTPSLLRRKSGAKGTTPRIESDIPEIVAGVYQGFTTGAPICILFSNNNTRSEDYNQVATKELGSPRPGHADFVAARKFNSFNDHRGGGHFSGRLTLCLVAAGVVAKKMLENIEIEAKVTQIKGVKTPEEWEQIIDQAIKDNNSVGGIVECSCTGVPIGLGEPFFASLESKISEMIFSIPGIRGIEFGDGFDAANMTGSQHNDCIISSDGKTLTNGAGGINGGISNGNPLIFRVAVKPTSSISHPQSTFNFETNRIEELSIKGRHDVCIALRVPVVVESAVAIVLLNAL